MYCYECAKEGREAPAVAICPACYAGLCLLHLKESAARGGPGGTRFGCTHDTWTATGTATGPLFGDRPPRS